MAPVRASTKTRSRFWSKRTHRAKTRRAPAGRGRSTSSGSPTACAPQGEGGPPAPPPPARVIAPGGGAGEAGAPLHPHEPQLPARGEGVYPLAGRACLVVAGGV